MSEHTPGPWTMYSGIVWQDDPNNDIPIALMHREAGNGTSPTERDANARLIAMAPELLDACQELIAVLEDELTPYAQGLCPELRHARAVTSEAQGEQVG